MYLLHHHHILKVLFERLLSVQVFWHLIDFGLNVDFMLLWDASSRSILQNNCSNR